MLLSKMIINLRPAWDYIPRFHQKQKEAQRLRTVLKRGLDELLDLECYFSGARAREEVELAGVVHTYNPSTPWRQRQTGA